jgi:RNA polymerase sigma-70 factor, ECF subfamily
MIGIRQQIAMQESGWPQEREVAAESQEEAFAALVNRQARFIFKVAYTVVRNTHDAEDIVQETFLRLHRSGSWQQVEDERALLARIAWRLAVDRVRSNGRGKEAAALEADLTSREPSPEQRVLMADRDATVRRLIDALPEELRLPLALSGMEGLTSRQIAGIMGIPEGTVRTRISRARELVKQKLRNWMEAHDK